MNWFWDNIHLKKEERVGMSIFICILFCLLMIKWYLVVIYVPKGEYNNYDLIENIEYSLTDAFIKESVPKSKSSHSFQDHKISKQKSKRSKVSKKEIKKVKALFAFDPNTISMDSLLLLGVNKYAASNIMKYRSKGGRFKKTNDLLKVYGLDSSTYNKIYPFAEIHTPKINQTKENYGKKFNNTDKDKYRNKNKPIAYSKPKLELNSIDINLADTTEFRKLKGIGSVYSKRIIKFRNSLGGYFSVDQIKEVWGVSDSLFIAIRPYLFVDPTLVEKKNINALNKEEIVKHPYIDWQKAKVILKYKKMHGDYKSMDDFRKMHGISEDFVDTLTQYFVAR